MGKTNVNIKYLVKMKLLSTVVSKLLVCMDFSIAMRNTDLTSKRLCPICPLYNVQLFICITTFVP